MKISNFKKLATTELRRKSLEIVNAGLMAVDTGKVINTSVKLINNKLSVLDKEFNLKRIENLYVVGVGKSSFEAVKELKNLLGSRLNSGLVIDIKDGDLGNVKTFKGTHPLPSEENKRASEYLVNFLKQTKEDDLVIFVISGGGSTLLHGSNVISPDQEASVLKELFKSGATIEEINTIRKHISESRGGNLVKYSYPSKSVSLIFSDVPGNDFQFISSGPTVKDNTTVEAAEAVLSKYNILNKVGIKRLSLLETPKDDKYFNNVTNVLVSSNDQALEAMARYARKLDLAPLIKTNSLRGEARDIGINIAKEVNDFEKGTVLLYAGETTVTIKGDGKGGRNQELVLGALKGIDKDTLVLSIASDGRDNTDNAGAICDINTLNKSRELGINVDDYLENNNSYFFFDEVGDYIKTGNTGSNVSDLILAIKDK